MAGYSFPFAEYLHGMGSTANLHYFACKLIRNAVIMGFIQCHMIIKPCLGLFELGIFIPPLWQPHKFMLLRFKEHAQAAALNFLEWLSVKRLYMLMKGFPEFFQGKEPGMPQPCDYAPFDYLDGCFHRGFVRCRIRAGWDNGGSIMPCH